MQNMQELPGTTNVHRRFFNVLYLITAISILFIGGISYLLWQQYQVQKPLYVKEAQSQMERMSQSMANELQLSIKSVDQMLLRIIEKQYTNLLFGRNLRDDVRHSISMWVNENPLVDAVVVTDKEGKIDILYARDKPQFDVEPGTVFAVNELLKHHDPTDEATFFAHALKSKRKDEKISLLVGRRVEGVDGEFHGVVSAAININYVTQLFENIANKSHIDMALVLDNEEVVVGKALQGMDLKQLQNLLTQNTTQATNDKEASGIISMENIYINDIARMVSSQALAPLPMTLILVAQEDKLLALWNAHSAHVYRWLIVSLVVFLLLLTVAIYALYSYREQMGMTKRSFDVMRGKSLYFVKASEKLVTPVHAITGFAQMLSEAYFGQVNKEQKQRLNDIQQCSSQVLESVEHIRELIAADIGMVQLQEEQVDITAMVQGGIQLFAARLQEQKISLVDNTLKHSVMIQADSRRFRQMILHVLSNAVQYTPAGGKITVSTYYDSQQNFIIEIADTGEGVAKSELKRILSPFDLTKEADPEQRNQKVSIGLPLCQLYANLHGGKLEVKSKMEQGTKIIIWLPKQRIMEQRVQMYEVTSMAT